MKKNKYSNISLVILIILQFLFLFYFFNNNITNQTVNAFGYFIVSVLYGVVLLYKFYGRDAQPDVRKASVKKKLIFYISLALTFIWLNNVTIDIMKDFDFPKHSDIIPAVQLMCKQYLKGGYVYSRGVLAPIYWYCPAGYLPAKWVPYLPAEYFHFDYRTVTFIIWIVAAVGIAVRSVKLSNNMTTLCSFILIFGGYFYISVADPSIIGITIELAAAGYYMMFIWGINQKNAILSGLFASLCLLSRYYLIFWLPLWAFVLFISGNRKELYKTIAATVFFISIFYIIPFLSKDWSSFYEGYKGSYSLLTSWATTGGQRPFHLFKGDGFAHLFYLSYYKTNYQTGYVLLQKVLLAAAVGTPVLLGAWYALYRKNIYYRIFLLASIKIFLIVFLIFITVPFKYLFVVDLFVSISIFAEQARYKAIEREAEEGYMANSNSSL